LEEAIAAYRRALAEQSRDRVPLDWAFTETNLGAAFVVLGEREEGTARLKEAVAALHEAQEERTRADTPFLWAQTQEKLALAHLALFDKGGEPSHRDDALNAIGGALEEYGKVKAVFYIEKATRLREKILAAVK
jgi:tetratricopeptide (TPR) repeat protein